MDYTKEITVLSEKCLDKRISFSLVLDDNDKSLTVYALEHDYKVYISCIPLDLNRASFVQIRAFNHFMFGDSRCIFLSDIPSLLFDLFFYCSDLFKKNE